MKKLLNKFNNKEFKLLETLLSKKGNEINISIVSNEISDMSNIPNDFFVSATYGSSSIVNNETRKLIFINDSFEFQEINVFSLLDESNSFNQIQAFISGDKIPKNSTFTFVEFPQIKLIIDEVHQIRPLSKVYKYLLVRG